MWRKRALAVITAMALSLVMFITPVMAADSGKTETVYASLGHDGSVENIYVVNHLTGSYTDYGTYSEIKNLSTMSEPVIDGDKITFADEPTTEGLFYQGTMTGQLPVTFDFRYYLDGEEVKADSLAGASGHLKIVMNYAPNQSCAASVRDGLMAQVSAVFNTASASNVSAGDASLVTVGSSVNASYIIMPDESGSFVMEADVTGFEMDPITISLLKGALSISSVTDSIGEFEDGMDDMINGADDMVDGTTDLKTGMKTLAGKASQLNDGLSALSDSGALMDEGMTQYETGLSTYISGVQALAPASAQIRTGLNDLATNGSAVASGVSAVNSSLSALASNTDDLNALAQSLASSPDASVQALASGVLEMIGGVQGLSSGLESASGGLDSYVAGVSSAAEGYAAFDDGMVQISDGGASITSGFSNIHSGFTSYQQGVSQSADGFNKMYLALKGLPSNVQELIDGQIEFKDGIVSAKDGIADKTDGLTGDSEPAVSFASPDKNHPDSVQYIMTTPGIKVVKVVQEQQVEVEEDFLDRLAALFN